MRKSVSIIGSLFMAILIVLFLPFSRQSMEISSNQVQPEEMILDQAILRVEKNPIEIHKVYHNGTLVGVLNDENKLDEFLNGIYQENYAEDYPESSVSLHDDVYVSKEMSYYIYEDHDEEILSYIRENELFAIKAIEVQFIDSDGVYAQIYVRNEDIYDEAMQEYLSYFIGQSELQLLNNGEKTPELKTYGSRSTGISIAQTITTLESYANAEEIMKTKEEVLEYLKYGENTEKQYYTVQRYDTVAGVGAKNFGLSASQVMNINRDVISSVDQVLAEGDVLCVTYFNSPIDIVITKESMRRENIYPETIYSENPNLRKGVSELKQQGVNGSKNALYNERWINGVLVSGTLISSVDTLQPINEIIEVGTMEVPGYGTGSFRWPVENPMISCGWGCYYGHRAIDVQNAYDRWGDIYAADRGVVEINDYNGINGNYVVIDHNNGYETYYGHMRERSHLEVGDTVDKGDMIGHIGMTGYASGPHVHFFIIEDGERRNPCDGFLDCR